MSTKPPELDLLVHALMSPLTIIQGTVQLLRHRLKHTDDKQFLQLLGALERSVVKLRGTCDVLIAQASLNGEQILIALPAETFQKSGDGKLPYPLEFQTTTTGGAGSALHTAETARTVGWNVLVVAGPASPAVAIGEALRTRGHTAIHVTTSAAGLDRARELRPAVVLIDPHVDAQSEMALQILGEDPDTKTIVVAVLGHPQLPAGALHPVLIDPELSPDGAALAIEQALAPGRAGGAGRPQVLIVDDEPDIAAMIAVQFEEEGYQTLQVHSGTDVLRIVREQQFGLILLDVMLPDLDGFTVLGGLRAQPETQLTPIILVSAINSPAEKVRGLQLGADDYITKPFSAAELSARAQAAMRRSEWEGGANPSTRLPGNIAIERAMSQRIAQGEPFAVCYCDIDNFKAYNDSYGFLKGDAVIQRTAQILLDAVRAHGNLDDFVGHIGGDDFVVISTPDRVVPICEAATARFDETAPLFYDPATRAKGFISGEDRQGRPTFFPLVSISIGVVSSAQRPFRHLGEVAQRSVESKKRAKLMPGSAYLLEE